MDISNETGPQEQSPGFASQRAEFHKSSGPGPRGGGVAVCGVRRTAGEAWIGRVSEPADWYPMNT